MCADKSSSSWLLDMSSIFYLAMGGFAMIFLSEYGNIMFLSMLTSMFLMNFLSNFMVIFLFTLLICSVVVFIRSSYPRFRYDLLMVVAWQVLLFLSFLFLIWMMMFVSL